MSTLRFNGSNQYVEFSTLSTALQNVPSGPHTIVSIHKRNGGTGVWSDLVAMVNNARNTTEAALGWNLGQNQAMDLTRVAASTPVGVVDNDTTNWACYAGGLHTSDTPDVIFHRRDHTGDGAFVHTNSTGNTTPGYGAALASNGFLQIGRWQTGDYTNADIAVIAIFNYRLTNAQLDEITLNDKTSDIANCSGGAPVFLCELNATHGSLVDLMGNATLVTPVNSPTLVGADPPRWTFDGLGPQNVATGGAIGFGAVGYGAIAKHYTVTADTTPPVPDITVTTATRMSRQVGKDSSDITFTSDEAFVEYQIRKVTNASDNIAQGALVETATVSSRSSHTVTITDDEIVAADGGSAIDGAKMLKVFVRDAAGNWSV